MVAQLGTGHLPQRVERHLAQGAKLLGTLWRRWDDGRDRGEAKVALEGLNSLTAHHERDWREG
eukprot:scaffold16214_cov73-Phaeocystis_antarctica.AAC.2